MEVQLIKKENVRRGLDCGQRESIQFWICGVRGACETIYYAVVHESEVQVWSIGIE